MRIQDISIIIPVFNSEKTLAPLVDLLVEKLSDSGLLEIVLINDCSQDNSEQVCIGLFKKYPEKIRLFSLAKNVGEHNAVMAGLNQSNGEYAVIMDDDFQNPVSEVIKLIEFAVNNNYDAVYTYYPDKKHSWFRNIGSAFNDKIANIMLKKPSNLYLSSFKIMNRFLIDEIIKYDLPFAYIDGLILRTTSNIGQIQVEHDFRKGGKSGYTLKKLISLWLNMFTSFSVFPLRIAMFLGFVFSIVGFILGLVVLYWWYTGEKLPVGYSSQMVGISMFSGIILISIGMVGEYVGRMFLSQNKQPQYSIRRKFEKN